jgi:hypothetical protein
MEAKRSDLSPSRLDLAFDADAIAFANMLEDVGSDCWIARHTQNPNCARRRVVADQYRRDGKRQFIGLSGQYAADGAGNGK